MQQNVLEKNPGAQIAVYAIWMPIFPDDARDRWPADALTDRRVVHWWDQDLSTGRWYAERMREMEPRLAPGSVDVGGTILWDAYLVYGPDVPWSDSASSLDRWGRPILATREHLERSLSRFTASSQ